MFRPYILIVLFFWCGGVFAQADFFSKLTYDDSYLPKDLLKTKSIVVLHEVGNGSAEPEWEKIANKVHPGLQRVKIDPVLYVASFDLFAGREIYAKTKEALNVREVAQVIFFIDGYNKIFGGSDRYGCIVAVFNSETNELIKAGEQACRLSAADLDGVLLQFTRQIGRLSLESENLLINDVPDLYQPEKVIVRNRFETINTDLRIDKLAIPVESFRVWGEDLTMEQIKAEIEQLMGSYTFGYEVIEGEIDVKKLRLQGFQFIMENVTSTQQNVRKYLGYKDAGDTDFTTHYLNAQGELTSRKINGQALVSKIYIKHLNSGDVFLGEYWDADIQWQKALANHISFLLGALNKK